MKTQTKNKSILQSHMKCIFKLAANHGKIVPDANFENIHGSDRCYTGIPLPTFNILWGYSGSELKLTQAIKQQKDFFQKHAMPFIWYVDSDDKKLEEELVKNGFNSVGCFYAYRGPVKSIDLQPIAGSSFKKVQNQDELTAFSTVLADAFDLKVELRAPFSQLNERIGQIPGVDHWIAQSNGEIVSCITTIVEGDHVSVWNAATKQEYRRKGFNSSLWNVALQEARQKGARQVVSYMMPDSHAPGICVKFEMQPEWTFQGFVGSIT